MSHLRNLAAKHCPAAEAIAQNITKKKQLTGCAIEVHKHFEGRDGRKPLTRNVYF